MIELLLSIDSNFVMQLMTTSVSLFRNNPNAQFQIHLLCTKVSESDKQRIREFIEGQGQRIVFYDADEVLLNLPHIPKSGRFTLSTYMRCFITRILPENISKILYMDCDILIRGNIDGLWNTDISGYAIGAVDDMWALRGNFERLGIPPEDSYFNNGVLLINLDYWRKADVYELSLQTIKGSIIRSCSSTIRTFSTCSSTPNVWNSLFSTICRTHSSACDANGFSPDCRTTSTIFSLRQQ